MKESLSKYNRKDRKNNRYVIVIVLLLVFVFVVYVVCGNSFLTVSRYDVHSEKIPPGFDGFRIVQISDLHNSHNDFLTDAIVSRTREEKPDVIFLTGDVIDSRIVDVDAAVAVVDQLKEIAPIYFVKGNHEARTDEYDKLSKAMRKAGIIELNNSCVTVRRHDDEIVIAGIDDPMAAHEYSVPDEVIAGNELSLLERDPEMYTILLSHRPELLSTYAANGMDLVFAGHAHGGLIRLPFIGGLYAPHQGLFPKYTEGSFRQASTEMIVSRGSGNSGDTFRINDNPEVVFAVLHAGE